MTDHNITGHAVLTQSRPFVSLSPPPLRYPSIWKYMIRLVERPACPEAYKEGMVRAEEASSGSSSNPLNALFGRKG